MTLRERIQSDLTAAMRSGAVLRRDVLRLVANALYLAEKAQRRPLSEDEALAVVTREAKMRRESIDAFQAGGREDLVAREAAELAIIGEYLPAALSEDELRALVGEAIATTGAASPRDLGRVMGWLAPRTRGRADGRHVSELVARALTGADLAAHDAAGHGAS